MDNLVKEDFSNVFDSSLIDYSEDFKRSDEIEQIYSWLDAHHGWTGRESRGLSEKDLRKKLHDKYKVEIKNGIAYVSYNPSEEQKGDKEIVLNFYFEESEAEIPFILMDNPNIDSFYIRLISESYNHARIKTALKDLKFISEIDSSKIIFRFNHVTIDNLLGVPSKGKLEYYEDENLITYDNLPAGKNTDFYFKDEKPTYRDNPLFGNEGESESMIFGVMSLGVNKDVTYEDIYKQILENINSSCLVDDKFIHISIESNRYKRGQEPSYLSYVNLFKIDGKKVLITYSKHSTYWHEGGTGDGHDKRANVEQPFILENGQLKYVKIDGQNNKIIENTDINPIKRLIGESFENVFDSSLIDYSDDFEKSDKHYRDLQLIKSWCQAHIDPEIYDIYPENYDQEEFEQSFGNDGVVINSDLSLSIHFNDINSNGMLESRRDSMNYPLDIPEYIKFNDVGNGFSLKNISDKSVDDIERGFPKHLVKSGDDSYGTYRIGVDSQYQGNVIREHIDFFKQLVKNDNPLHYTLEFIDYRRSMTIMKIFLSKNEIVVKSAFEELNLHESFENVFDSSLIDYAPDFEEQDKVQQIKNWMELYAHPMDYFNHNMIEGTVDYDLEKIGDSYIINLNEGTLIYDYNADEKDAPMFIGDSFPSYIKFNKCNGDFSISPNFATNGKLSLRDCPREINGSFEITNGPCSVDVDLSEGPEYVLSNYICMQQNSGINTCKTELYSNSNGYYMLSMTTKEKEELNDNGYLFKGMAIHYDESNELTLDGTEKYDGEPFAGDGVLIYRIHEDKKYLYGIADLGDFGLDVAEYDSPSTGRGEMVLEDPRMMSDKELSIFRKVFSTKQQRTIRRFFDKKNVELGNNINESFENVFDSSLIDYAPDFEEQDKILYQDRCDKINKWLSDMGLLTPDEDGKERTYKINNDFTIDASGHIDIDSFQLEKIGIPEYIQFNEVGGSFHISFCDHLQNPIINPKVNERGAIGFGPKIVHGKYGVSYNNELEDLRGCPEIVEGEFVCIHNSGLKTFEYFPKRVEGDFTYYSNGLELDYEGTLFDGRIGNGWTPERLRNTYYIGGKIDDGNYHVNKKQKV